MCEEKRPGDKDTWTILLDTANIERPSVPYYFIEHSTFETQNLDGLDSREIFVFNADNFENQRVVSMANMSAELVASPSLKYRYTMAKDSKFWTRILRACNDQGITQAILKGERKYLRALDGTGLLRFTTDVECRLRSDSWEYLDKSIPGQYREWLLQSELSCKGHHVD
jgi:hypothetical protein